MSLFKKYKILLVVPLLILLASGSAQAVCLQDCQHSQEFKRAERVPSFTTSSAQAPNRYRESFNREKSHNMGSVTNSIVGDVTIRVGHEKMEIKDMNRSHHNVIDASVTSVVNLGDTKNQGQ